MRLALIISQLGPGGAERVMTALADEWAGQGHDVTLITLSSLGEDFYPVSSKVRRVGLGLMSASAGCLDAVRHNVNRLRSLRASILAVKPDCVVSFTDKTNVLVLLAMVCSNVPVVVSERIDPRQYRIGRVWTILRRVMYRRAAGLVVQTEELRPWAEDHAGRDRVHVVPNPVRSYKAGDLVAESRLSVTEPYVVAMGRLTHQKGFDLLIEAFAEVLGRGQYDRWSLVILGEGEWRGRLEKLVERLGLCGRVFLRGVVRDPGPWLSRAGLFVLSSRYEGYPNALLEAMACGLACVSYDCSAGPGEIISDGEDGRLVRPVGATGELAQVMADLMAAPRIRERLGANARQSAERFAVESVAQQWIDLFHRVRGTERDMANNKV